MKPRCTILVGPCGSGKSTYANELRDLGYFRVSQDDQGKDNHLALFKNAIDLRTDIVVDRMNFDKKQRERYIKPAKEAGYEIKIVVFHVPRQTCFERACERIGHPTINGKVPELGNECDDVVLSEKRRQANSALDTFFTKYERVEDTEADIVLRLGWESDKKETAIICDLDGTLCNITHRLHHVKHEVKKHNRWDLFNKEIPNDSVNQWCKQIIENFYQYDFEYMPGYAKIVLCSGRVDSSRSDTTLWLEKHNINYNELFMRHRSDFRQDYIIKEIIYEFEIKPRYKVMFAIDDRQQVVDLWRRHGLVCLQCDKGDF